MIQSFGHWHRLEQLAEEDYLISLTDRWLLSWDALYRLLEDDEHASSLPLIGVPEILPLRANLSSRGALSDSDFRIWIAQWATLPARHPSVSAVLVLFYYEESIAICYRGKTRVLIQATERLSTQQISDAW
jgi:hypothetical protein